MTPQPPYQPPKPRQQKIEQLKWPESEVSRISNRIQVDYRAAESDHKKRIGRWREYLRRWRAATDIPGQGEETASNLAVPMLRWNLYTKWAKEMDALFGDDAEIVAVPVGPSDYRKDKKISRYMTWRVFNSMKLMNPFCEFVLNKLIYGRSVAFSQWQEDKYEVDGKEVIDYSGPGFVPLWPDDFIVPAEEVRSLHDFSWVIRRHYETPQTLLEGEEKGRYQHIKENWETIVSLAQRGMRRDWEGETIRREKDAIEGIDYEHPQSAGEWLTVYEWYGKWRPLKSGKKNASEWDFKNREMKQQEFVVQYLYPLNLVIGIQRLEDLYPTMRYRRPFVESAMVKDGTYWSPGMCEMLLELEDELRVNHNLGTEAAQFAATPMFGYRPASGVTADTFRASPGLFVPLDNPATDIRELTVTANLEMITWKEQTILAYVEKLTGLGDLQMGRQSDRPNAPRTATQTVKLLEEGNVRISLDTKVLQEDMSQVLTHFWQLEYLYSPPQEFFRVTEADADGLFEVNHGGAMLESQDRDGRYDFKLQFANSVWSKEMKKEQALARYQLDLANPLIATNPRALWATTRDAHEALGDPNFSDMVPEPPAADIPVNPMEEWTRMQEGETVNVNPQDNDAEHLARHYKDYEDSTTDPFRDPEAQAALKVHYMAHVAQLQMKSLQQAIVQQAAEHATAQMQQGQGQPGGAVQFPAGLFGNPPTQPEGNPEATGPYIYSGHPEVMHQQ